jgi:hypothetical protein
MEEKLNEMAEQLKALIDKVSNLESNSVSKNDLAEQIKPLLNEIPAIRSEMISKNDLKVKVKTITGKDIDLYVKNTDKVIDLKSKLKEKEKISEDQQYLFLDEKLLNDNSTISESNIKESSNLYLMKSDDEIFNFASPQEKRFIVNALQKNLGKGIRTLLYSARKDGDDANTFHNKCDRNKDLLYLIKTTNDVVFAIYIDKPLLSDGNSRTDSLQMVISPANKFAIKSLNNNATYHCQSGQGAKFHCMQLNTPFLSSNCCDINSCNDFNLPAYPSGNSSYQIKELEVYCLKDLELEH